MPRYIDAEKAVARFEACLWGKDYDGVLAKSCIDDAPTADVVEVVRCKDCEHYKQSEADPNRKMCRRKDVDGFPVCYDFCPTDYCSYGERRTDDDRA